MVSRKIFGLLAGCVCLLGIAHVRAAKPAAGWRLGAGLYQPAAAASDLDCARWDWMFINFGAISETPEGIQELNRYLALNPHQKYLVRLWPINNVGRPEYGGQAKFLDYWFNDAVREKLRANIVRQIKLVRDNLDKPQNVVGYTFLEEEPGYFGLGKEIKASNTTLPPAVVHYRQAIEKAYGHPVQWNEPFWRWLGQRYVAAIDDIHRLIRKEAPGKLILFWPHSGYRTLDEASFDGFPSKQPMLYPYHFSDVIKKPLCDGFMAYPLYPEAWEKRYMSRVRENGWLFFTQLSHPGWMRTVDWATALKEVKEPLTQNLGYFFYCAGPIDNVPPSPSMSQAAVNRVADPTVLKLEASNEGRFLTRVDESGHGKVIRVSQDVDRIATDVFQWQLPVTAGKAYQWAVSVKTRKVQGAKRADGAYMAIVFDCGRAHRVDMQTVHLTGDKDWERLSGQVVAPANAARARVYVGLGRATGDAWFNDVSLRAVDENKELLTNGGFEKGQDSPLKLTGWFIRDDSITVAHWRAFCDEQHIGDDVVDRAELPQLDQ